MREEVRLPTVSIDYMFMQSKQERDEEKGMPILVLKYDSTNMTWARVVPTKGSYPHAIERECGET